MLSNFNASSIAGCNSASVFTLNTPTLEPSQEGLTNTGKPNFAIIAAESTACPRFTTTISAVGKPTACHNNLVRNLSKVIADAITPQPV